MVEHEHGFGPISTFIIDLREKSTTLYMAAYRSLISSILLTQTGTKLSLD